MNRIAELNRLAKRRNRGQDVVLSIAPEPDGSTVISSPPGARKVAWKHPSGEPVWAALIGG